MADESKVLGIRVDAAEKERFEKYVAEERGSNKEFLSTLLGLYELNKNKANNINLVGDIEELEKYTNKIHQSFINIVNKLESQKEDIVLDSNKELLIYKEKVNTTQDELVKLKQEKSTNDAKLTDVNNVLLTLQEQNKALNESLKDKTSLVEEYKGKNDTLAGILEEYKAYKVDNEKLKQLLAELQADNTSLNGDIKDKHFTISGLNKDIEILKTDSIKIVEQLNSKHTSYLEQLKNENNININKLNADLKAKDDIIDSLKLKHATDLEKLEQSNQKELESFRKENELNIKLASAEIREELNNKSSQEQLKHNKEIETYQSKYKSLLEELEQSRKVKNSF